MFEKFIARSFGFIFRLKCIPALVLTLTLVACQNPVNGYVRHGIGTDLYSEDLENATKNLNIYFGFICHQAGIAGSRGKDGFPRCQQPLNSSDLTLLVQTGFNDIDRRCDGYLGWLEDARHRDAFYNSQLNQVARLTNSILTATSPGAGVTIGIVAEAFGYAKSAFSDHQARIMLGYESSTIKTIVSQRRLDFRNEFSSQRFNTKPDAVFVLRSYLRICMPYTITMDANTYARAVVSGNPPPNYNSAGEIRTAISPAAPLRATAQITRRARNRTPVEGSTNPDIDPPIALVIQQALCVSADGRFGPKTKEAIRIFQRREGVDSSGELDTEQAAVLSDIGKDRPCNSNFRNYLERDFGEFEGRDESQAAVGLRVAMQKASDEKNLQITVPGATTFNGLRTSISELKQKLGIAESGSEAYLNQQITADFLDAIGFGG